MRLSGQRGTMPKRLLLSVFLVVTSVFVLASLYGNKCYARNAQSNSSTRSNINVSTPQQPIDKASRPPYEIENPRSPSVIEVKNSYLTPPEIILSGMIILLTMFTLVIQFLLLKKDSQINAEETMRVFGVTLIIMGTLFFITAGFCSGPKKLDSKDS
jgi:hypothetical protein